MVVCAYEILLSMFDYLKVNMIVNEDPYEFINIFCMQIKLGFLSRSFG